jgi:ankyrin repeat protein
MGKFEIKFVVTASRMLQESPGATLPRQPSPPPGGILEAFRSPSPTKRRRKKFSLTAKQIFESPKVLTRLEYKGGSNDKGGAPGNGSIVKQLMEKNPPIDVVAVSHRAHVPPSNDYREKLGTVIFKVKPIKHTPRKRHIVLRADSMEHKLFHDVNKPRKEDGRTPLFLAAMRGDVDEIKLLYKFGADVNQRVQGYYSWDHGKSPLYSAAEKGMMHAVRLLLKYGAIVDLPDHEGRTPLHAAADAGQDHIVHVLIHFGGADIDCETNEGETPLFQAAMAGHTPMVQELLESGANPNHRRHDGWSPMHAAARGGHGLTVVKLHEHGGLVNLSTRGHRTPLSIAERITSKQHSAAVNILRSFGALSIPVYKAFRDACFSGDNDHVIELIRHNEADVNMSRDDGVTPIWIASHQGHTIIVKTLLENGANANAVSMYGDTPLAIATQQGFTEIVRMLKSSGANGWTKVHIAAEDNAIKLIQKLAAKGHDLNKPDDEGQSPAHIAVEHCNLEALEQLSKCGADLHQTSENRQTPLDIAKFNIIVNGADKWLKVREFLQEWSAFEAPEITEERKIREAAYLIQRRFRLFMKMKRTKEKLDRMTSTGNACHSRRKKRKVRSPEVDAIKFVSPAHKRIEKRRIDPIDLIPMTTLSMFDLPKKAPQNKAKERLEASLRKRHAEQTDKKTGGGREA